MDWTVFSVALENLTQVLMNKTLVLTANAEDLSALGYANW